MEATDLLKIIRDNLETKLDSTSLTTPISYYQIKMQYKVQFGILDKVDSGYFKRFTVIIEDNTHVILINLFITELNRSFAVWRIFQTY